MSSEAPFSVFNKLFILSYKKKLKFCKKKSKDFTQDLIYPKRLQKTIF